VQTGLALFAYGKLGSNELNLSSDVDLVLVSESEDPQIQNWLRHFRSLLQDVTEDGFCFRLDFDLRPGGRMGQIVPTLSQFEDYFSNYGEAWERLAFVRFRGVCGDESLLKKCLSQALKFTYRRHLDFGLMEDSKVLRQRIHEQNWKRSQDGALDLKLGLGGIRDLELFVHTLQVIHGGRHVEFRTESTMDAIERLTQAGLLQSADKDFLINHYWTLRHFENALQGATDQQMQVLKAGEWSNLITDIERSELKANMQKCQALVTTLLGAVDENVQSLPETENEQHQWLLSLGFSQQTLQDLWPRLSQKGVLSRQPERDELYRKRFLYEMVQRLAASEGHPDAALQVLYDFLHAIRAKAAFFHLLLKNPRLMDRLSLLFSHSRYLSQMLINRPELLDSFLYQTQNAAVPEEWDDLLTHCLESKLLSQLTAGLDFLKNRNLTQLLENVTATADRIVTLILEKLKQEYGSKLEVLAMGKWGGRELGLHSDLDLVLITDDAPTEADTKVARRLISRLTEAHKGGAIYQLDFRLKPQGKGGPLMSRKSEVLTYLRHEAQIWERQAYLKARCLDASGFDEQIRSACVERVVSESEWESLRDIGKKLKEKSQGPLDLKYEPGGLVHTEFAAQLTRLFSQEKPRSASMRQELIQLSQSDKAWLEIARRYDELRELEQTLRIVTARSSSSLNEGSDELRLLAGALQQTPEQMARRISALLAQNAALLAPLDPRNQNR